jgi:hypothetical protein
LFFFSYWFASHLIFNSFFNLIQSNSEIWIQFFFKKHREENSRVHVCHVNKVKIICEAFWEMEHTLVFWKIKIKTKTKMPSVISFLVIPIQYPLGITRKSKQKTNIDFTYISCLILSIHLFLFFKMQVRASPHRLGSY